jgi:20S proteasome subunit alpha 7
MLVPGSNRRIHTCDQHAGITMSGLAADARQLVNKAREESSEYRSFYGSLIPGQVLNDRLALHVHSHTLYWYLRPFGCSILLAVFDELKGPQLYSTDPSGVAHRYFACAIGKSKTAASSELEKIDFTKITVREAVNKITNILYKLHDEAKDKELEVELSWVCEESNRKHVFVPAQVREEAIRLAKEAKQREEMEDSDDEADKQ